MKNPTKLMFFEEFGALGGLPGALWGPPGSLRGPLGGLLRASWASWSPVGPSWGPFRVVKYALPSALSSRRPLPGGPKRPPGGPRRRPRGPKRPPGGPQEAPRGPKSPPEGPRRSPRCPRRLPRGPKRPLRGSSAQPRGCNRFGGAFPKQRGRRCVAGGVFDPPPPLVQQGARRAEPQDESVDSFNLNLRRRF